MEYYTSFDTPLCKIILVGDSAGLSNIFLMSICNLKANKKVGLFLRNGRKRERTARRSVPTCKLPGEWFRNDAFFADIVSQINEYLSGKRRKFNVKINPQGTDFQKKVWNELRKIPYGKLYSYKDIAKAIGNPKACRAVGMANSKNPIPIIIPCHRVIGTNGKLTGFSSGLAIKEKLIKLETDQVKLPTNSAKDFTFRS